MAPPTASNTPKPTTSRPTGFLRAGLSVGSAGAMTDVQAGRIVIVDDLEANLLALKELLAVDGFQSVETTTDPAAVLRAVDEAAVDLVVVDLQMPGVSGLELIQQIQGRLDPSNYLPILMLTAHASTSLKRQALATGAHDFVVKPFDAGEVLLRIRNLLSTRALHVELDQHRHSLTEALVRHEEKESRRAEELTRKRRTIERALTPGAMHLVFQPVFDLQSRALLGVEGLTRFDLTPERPPNEWFAEAAEVGLSAELQLASIEAALTHLPNLPAPAFLAMNLSADIVFTSQLTELLQGVDLGRVVFELTEHTPVQDYEQLLVALGPLRAAGLRLAIDDAGAGYAGFQHILRLRPDIIKLDLDLTRGIDRDPVRRALAAALVTFGHEIGALLVAEGVETVDELDVLTNLGFGGAQGYYLGRPAALAVAVAAHQGGDVRG